MEFSKKLNNTSRYPTSLLVRGADALGVEIAKSLLEQGGYVLIVDNDTPRTRRYLEELKNYKLLTVLDYAALPNLDDDIRRLDYVFYFQHDTSQLEEKISSQEFLQYSNYLDLVLDLGTKFDAKFLLTTSIKAHQRILNTQDVDYDLTSQRQSAYTEFEVQRYSETLVKEYQEKVGIDARVLRLGVILGKGLEVNPDLPMVKLIEEAINGENLLVPGDGLETDYYVHYLDAAYGIIKGQFSLNTKGKIYTLSNEEEISILSVAYKLLDIIPAAKEIRFADDNSLPPLRLYKPAENLSVIGWKPRISFERALAQTVDFIRAEISKGNQDNTLAALNSDLNPADGTQANTIKHKKTFKDKLLGFFFVGENEVPVVAEGVPSLESAGPLQRLIDERKSQERARKGSIILANNRLKDKLKPEREYSPWERLDRSTNNMFLGVKSRFDFLKRVTLTDFLFATLALIAFLIVYFVVISPVFSLAKDLGFAAYQMNTLSNSTDFANNKKLSGEIKDNLQQSQQRLSDLEFIFNISQTRSTYAQSQKILSQLEQYFAGYEEVFTALQPYQDYLNNFNSNLTYRFNDNNILSVNPTVDYAAQLALLSNNLATFNIGTDRIAKAQPGLDAQIAAYPSWIQNYFAQPIAKLEAGYTQISLLQKSYSYLPSILGVNKTRVYLLVLQDNARYTPGGGAIAGYITLKVSNGAITDIRVKNFADFTGVYTGISSDALEEIKLVTTGSIDATNVTAKDLALINDNQILLRTVKEFVEQQDAAKYDVVAGVDLQVLEQLLKTQTEIDFRDSLISADNLLPSINQLLGDTKTDSNRNDIIINIWAKVLESELNNLKANYENLTTVFGSAGESNDVRYYTSDQSLQNFIYLIQKQPSAVKDFVDFGLNYDQKNNVVSKYPVETISLKVKVNANRTTIKTVTLAINGAESLQNTFVCFPSGTKIDGLIGVTSDKASQVFNKDKLCNLFLTDDDLKYGINASTVPFEIDTGNEYNYKLLLNANPGISSNYDIEFSFADSFSQIIPQDNSFIKQGDAYVYSASFRGNKEFSFILK